ncbi:ADP-ribosylglycohydrolase family protein [Streptomyces sp. ALI-76-A]|uniref:ADP-ribosylglycohydrolase family protein n=1 Tax=Streptomyces sp. ALI-76-A TaxID=3025736 RepID=UPI00256EF710|nr:ADP-ribosylglycohydrolase family protein [Streptomyces sp. ALI-76-A]MDL5205975.1 ADP-ribosylglycohydrolase family protein [Streptomyces sp. ALI-76-A]
MKRIQRAAGAVVGSAVGDALGGPFEFGPQGAFSVRFPTPGAGDCVALPCTAGPHPRPDRRPYTHSKPAAHPISCPAAFEEDNQFCL